MRRFGILLLLLPVLLVSLVSCAVHEWPDYPDKVSLHLRLHYETSMTEWEHQYDGTRLTESGLGEVYDNRQEYGTVRYVIRAYPISEKRRASHGYTHEFVYTKDLSEGYDHEVTLEMYPGDYDIMVWSDLVERSADAPFYDCTNFAEISLSGPYRGNTDHRDAFRGTNVITLVSDIVERAPDTLDVTMQRPLAKYEFITTDLQEFIDKEIEYLAKEAATKGESAPTRVETDAYKVVFYFSGYMPDVYNMNTDKPIDSVMGVQFDSRLDVLSSTDASLGFDYVFVNGHESGVSVRIGLYDGSGRQVALSDPIDLPLRRSHHTILRGSFLIQQATGGLVINPEFDGNYIVPIP